jgi:hypothetical protein
MAGYRRRPVPQAWRACYHELRQTTRYHARGAVRGQRVYRSSGVCSCGARFGLAADRHNMDAGDVREAWRDHVETAYHDLWLPAQRSSS